MVSDQHRQPTLLGHGLWMFSVSRLLSYGCPFFRFPSSHLASSRPRFFSQRPSGRFLVVEPCQPRPNESLARGPCSRMTRRPGVSQYKWLTPVWLHLLHSIEVLCTFCVHILQPVCHSELWHLAFWLSSANPARGPRRPMCGALHLELDAHHELAVREKSGEGLPSPPRAYCLWVKVNSRPFRSVDDLPLLRSVAYLQSKARRASMPL